MQASPDAGGRQAPPAGRCVQAMRLIRGRRDNRAIDAVIVAGIVVSGVIGTATGQSAPVVVGVVVRRIVGVGVVCIEADGIVVTGATIVMAVDATAGTAVIRTAIVVP